MSHRQKQIEVIDQIEKQVKNNSLNFSIVSPTGDYEKDPRICLTSVHLPRPELVEKIQATLINPLRSIKPDYYYYGPDSLHMTIKNVRVINNPPEFNDDDISKAEKVFSEVTTLHRKFKVYFYRLLLFPNNLSLMGTTDPEMDEIILDLDRKLKDAGVGDDKKYTNSRYFFCNMTLARFSESSESFRGKVEELSAKISFDAYTVDSVTLVTCNAVFKMRKFIKTWNLK